ncbi:MAG: hypothetical protein QM537_00485 [Candidatus Symbiobacter sp.]|nr:hypothetical protein [Candidatus Symbiobacter sp.]
MNVNSSPLYGTTPTLPTTTTASVLAPSQQTVQDKIKAMANQSVTPSLSGALTPVSSIKAAQDLRAAAKLSATAPVAVNRAV